MAKPTPTTCDHSRQEIKFRDGKRIQVCKNCKAVIGKPLDKA